MSSILRVHGLADGTLFAKDFWVEGYDLDIEPARKESYTTPDGGAIINGPDSSIALTADRKEAKRFDSVSDALAAWNTQSAKRPYRPDGRPNKPLTALTVEVEPG